MRIAITLNDVVRNYNESFNSAYDSYLLSLEQHVGSKQYSLPEDDMEDVHQHNLIEEDVNIIKDKVKKHLEKLENDENVKVSTVKKEEMQYLNLPFSDDNFWLTHNYKFPNQKEYLNFRYLDYAFEICGRASLTYPNVISDLNKLFITLSNMSKDAEVIIVSKEMGNSKFATLNFLGVNMLKTDKIHWVRNYNNVWDEYDVIITANPFILSSKPSDKSSIKIETEYNKNLSSDESYVDLKEVLEKM